MRFARVVAKVPGGQHRENHFVADSAAFECHFCFAEYSQESIDESVKNSGRGPAPADCSSGDDRQNPEEQVVFSPSVILFSGSLMAQYSWDLRLVPFVLTAKKKKKEEQQTV